MFTIVQLILSVFKGIKNKKFLGIVGIVIGMYIGYQYMSHHYHQKGYKAGKQETIDYYEALIKETKEAYLKRFDEMSTELRIAKAKEEENLRRQEKEYLRGKEDGEKLAKSVISDHESGVKRLRVEVDTRRDETTKTGASTCACGDRQPVRKATLSTRYATALITQAKQADDTLLQLNLCKQTIHSYRSLVEKYNQQLDEKYDNRKITY